jgi:uncharacterized protein (TIRG00374 family)
MARVTRPALRHLYRAAPVALALGLGVYALRSADLPRVALLLGSLGWRLPLLLLPNFAVALLEAVAWRRSFALLGGLPRLGRLLRVRLTTEAVMLGVPSGALVSESLQPYLLKRHCGVPLETGVVASVGRKFFVVVSHGLVLAGVTFLTWPLLERLSSRTIRHAGLPWVLLALAVFMIVTFGAGFAAGARARMAERVRRLLDWLMGRWIGAWLERHASRFERTDEQLLHFFERDRKALLLPMLLYSAGWVVRGFETLVYLRVLGVPVSLTVATAIEATIVLVRSVAVPVPAGLGVQDAAYVLTFEALGIPDAMTVGTAFVLLKRGKDLFWILFGFALLALGERRGTTPAAAPEAPASTT